VRASCRWREETDSANNLRTAVESLLRNANSRVQPIRPPLRSTFAFLLFYGMMRRTSPTEPTPSAVSGIRENNEYRTTEHRPRPQRTAFPAPLVFALPKGLVDGITSFSPILARKPASPT
jgi:hypothetical protein